MSWRIIRDAAVAVSITVLALAGTAAPAPAPAAAAAPAAVAPTPALAPVQNFLVPLHGSAKFPKTPSTRVVLTERAQIERFDPSTGQGTQTGTFVAAGAVDDSGVVTANFQIGPGGDLTSTFTLTGSGGTITGFTKAKARPFPSTTRSFAEGKWKFLRGTDRYAGIHGRGKLLATIDFTTGQVTIARDGSLDPDPDAGGEFGQSDSGSAERDSGNDEDPGQSDEDSGDSSAGDSDKSDGLPEDDAEAGVLNQCLSRMQLN